MAISSYATATHTAAAPVIEATAYDDLFGGSAGYPDVLISDPMPMILRLVDEAAKDAPDEEPAPGVGLWTDMLDIDRFVAVNALPEVTNPIMLSASGFTPDGLLSYELFGISAYDRRNRFAYIDLKTHYMNPVAAVKLRSYDRKLADCLFARAASA